MENIHYYGDHIAVSKEVADYLKSDRKRRQAERRRDKRHLSMYNYERELDLYCLKGRFDLENAAIENLLLESLRGALSTLSHEDYLLLYLRFWQDFTLEALGNEMGMSKVAVHKRLNKLLGKLRVLIEEKPLGFSLFIRVKLFLKYWLTTALRVSLGVEGLFERGCVEAFRPCAV